MLLPSAPDLEGCKMWARGPSAKTPLLARCPEEERNETFVSTCQIYTPDQRVDGCIRYQTVNTRPTPIMAARPKRPPIHCAACAPTKPPASAPDPITSASDQITAPCVANRIALIPPDPAAIKFLMPLRS